MIVVVIFDAFYRMSSIFINKHLYTYIHIKIEYTMEIHPYTDFFTCLSLTITFKCFRDVRILLVNVLRYLHNILVTSSRKQGKCLSIHM